MLGGWFDILMLVWLILGMFYPAGTITLKIKIDISFFTANVKYNLRHQFFIKEMMYKATNKSENKKIDVQITQRQQQIITYVLSQINNTSVLR